MNRNLKDFLYVLAAFSIFVITIIVLYVFLASILQHVQTSVGEKRGSIVKLERSGVFFKTYQGELIRGGFNSGSGANGTRFHFNLGTQDNDFVKSAFIALAQDKPVILTYHCSLMVPFWHGSDGCTADKILIEK